MYEDDSQKISTWRNRWLMKPENYLRFGWEVFIMIVLIVLGIIVPYSTAFEPENSELSQTVDIFTLTIFSIDIVINFNTGIYEKGELMMDRFVILKSYLAFWFWIDLISTVPLDSLLEAFGSSINDASKAVRYLRALRAFKLIKIIRLTKLKILIIKIKDRISNKKILSLITLFKLFLYIFLIAHLFACIMYKISSEELAPNTFITRIINNTDELNDKLLALYISSLYWAVVTMASIGYGDYSPQTSNERIFGVITMLVSSCTFGFIVGNIGSILQKYNEKENQRREITVKLNNFMKRENLSTDLRTKTRKYMEYVFSHQKSANINVSELLSLLSLPLQEQVLVYTNGSLIKSIPVFSIFEQNFEQKFSRVLENIIFSPSDILIREGEKPQGMFFIMSGIVEIYDDAYRCKIQSLGEGESIGEIGLFTKQNCVSTAAAGLFVEAYFLSIQVFYDIIEDYPKVKNMLNEIRESCIEGNYTALKVSCYLCRKLGHITRNCSEIMNDENSKRNWIRRRQSSQLVYIDREMKIQRKKRERVRRSDYSNRNVIGKNRKLIEMFPRVRRILPFIKKYLIRKNKSHEDRHEELNNISEESIISKNLSVAPKSADYELIIHSSDEDCALCEVTELRNVKFDMSLLK